MSSVDATYSFPFLVVSSDSDTSTILTPAGLPMTPMNSMATLIPSENNRKRRRVDDTEAALQANNSQDDGNNSQDDKDTLRNHEHVLQVDEVAGGGPGKAYQDMFGKLDLIWHRLRVLVEQPLSSRNASEEETERRDLETEIGNLRASLGRLEQKAGVLWRD